MITQEIRRKGSVYNLKGNNEFFKIEDLDYCRRVQKNFNSFYQDALVLIDSNKLDRFISSLVTVDNLTADMVKKTLEHPLIRFTFHRFGIAYHFIDVKENDVIVIVPMVTYLSEKDMVLIETK